MAKWLWPCPGYSTITSGVGPRWGKEHKGIDISAPEGAAIMASREGTVTRAEYSSSYGNVVYINHGDGYETRYAHMVERPLVNKGQKVSQGQQIGKVGSTGYSTGNHLHFEVRKDNIVKDPQSYVSPTNTIYVADSPETTDVVNVYETPSSNAIDTDILLNGVKTRDFIDGRIFHAYLRILVGDKELVYEHGKPSIIIDFEISRLEGAGDRVSFTLFDDNWDDIEVYLAENQDNIVIQYGYSGGILSPKYKMILQDYSLDFKNTGVILHINAISDGIYVNLKPITLDTGTKNPGIAIQHILHSIGFQIDYSDFVKTEDVDREETYKLVNVNPITYIYNTIVPEARSQSPIVGDVEGNIKDSSVSGTRYRNTENIVFFLDQDNRAHLRAKTYGKEGSDALPTYVYMKGYDSVVEDLSFNMKGIFGGTTQFHTVTSLRSGIFSKDKSEKSIVTDIDSSLTTSPGRFSSTPPDHTGSYVPAGETEDQIDAILNYHVKNGANQAYEANMTILGDPNIQIMDEIRIINITDSGHLHHTSGRYLVKGISDSISNGNFRTSLVLIRNGDIELGRERTTGVTKN